MPNRPDKKAVATITRPSAAIMSGVTPVSRIRKLQHPLCLDYAWRANEFRLAFAPSWFA
jgi:hypothetical protein